MKRNKKTEEIITQISSRAQMHTLVDSLFDKIESLEKEYETKIKNLYFINANQNNRLDKHEECIKDALRRIIELEALKGEPSSFMEKFKSALKITGLQNGRV
jgi:hypothetical protein